MDKLVADLLEIERAALESMKDLEEEQAAQAQHISNEISRRNLEIKRSADRELKKLKQDAEADTQAQLDEIERQYQTKAAELKNLFESKGEIWRKEWVAKILNTPS